MKFYLSRLYFALRVLTCKTIIIYTSDAKRISYKFKANIGEIEYFKTKMDNAIAAEIALVEAEQILKG